MSSDKSFHVSAYSCPVNLNENVMRAILFKITLALSVISYAACNSSETAGPENEKSAASRDSTANSTDSLGDVDDEWVNEIMLSAPFGDGDSVGDHNITIVRDGGVAFVKLIKSNGINQKPTVLDSVNLSTHTARIALNGGNVVVQEVGTGALHNTTVRSVIHTSKSDFKITNYSPLLSGNAFVVGAEDSRLGVSDRRATHTVYKLPTSTSSIRVSEKNASELEISRWSFSTVLVFPDLQYCVSNQSMSGVNYWGEKFSHSCQ
jgi:hypothetical protein